MIKSYSPPSTVTSGMASTCMAMERIGASRIAEKADVPRCGVVLAFCAPYTSHNRCITDSRLRRIPDGTQTSTRDLVESWRCPDA